MPISTVRRMRRRQFLSQGTRAMTTFFVGASFPIAQAAGPAFKPLPYHQLSLLGPLLPPDENGLRLPAGFRSRVIARSGRQVLPSSSYRWHDAPDGGACYATGDGGWIYVSNSEVKENRGGVGAIRFNAQAEVVDAYSILAGTNNNCAGGKTPWNTWLSCEEIDRGQVYECDPFGQQEAQARPALGRFKHEAVAVDHEQSILYLTEDQKDGKFYRFRPHRRLPDLQSGELEVAEVVDQGDEQFVRWHPVPDPQAEQAPTRYQVSAATAFNGGEGIAWSAGQVYFTTKGDNRVWAYDCRRGSIGILYDIATSSAPHLSGVDNVTITASGDVMVAEDGGDMQIVLLTLSGSVVPVLQIVGQDESEICGPAFDPTFQRLYFSSQTGPRNLDSDGLIYEVSYSGAS